MDPDYKKQIQILLAELNSKEIFKNIHEVISVTRVACEGTFGPLIVKCLTSENREFSFWVKFCHQHDSFYVNRKAGLEYEGKVYGEILN